MSRSNAEVTSHRHGRVARMTGRHRWLAPVAWVAAAAIAAAVIVVVTLNTAGAQRPKCTGTSIPVTVAAPGPLLSVLDGLAKKWNATSPAADGRCVSANIVRKDANEVAAALGPNWDDKRDGPRPDVWVADSSLWLQVAATRPDAQPLLAIDAPSLASSPVVLAVRRPLAEALGWPKRQFGWDDVFGAFVQPDVWPKLGHPEYSALKVGITDPTSSTAGLAAVMTLLDRNGDNQLSNEEITGGIAFTQSLGGIAPDTNTYFGDQKPTSPVAAFPAVERDVADYDAKDPAIPLVPIYLPANTIIADYPYSVLKASWVDAPRKAAAAGFLKYLQGAPAKQAIAKAGFRAADHTIGDVAALPQDRGFSQQLPPARKAPDAAGISALITQWTSLQRQNNILVVLDTSGSMNAPVPGTPQTRLQLLQQTAIAGFGLLTNRTNIGLWRFSVDQLPPDGKGGFQELVPYGPMSANVGNVPRVRALQGSVAALKASGFTPLYNTAYAAFKQIQSTWTPNATNAVLLITDGKNDFDTGMALPDLLNRLTTEQQAEKPVQIISIAVGPEADADALQQMSKATGGRTFVARDPASAVQTLVLAFAGRLS
jgi:Ca-activated chloride channel family protein